MIDPRLKNWADTLIHYSLSLKAEQTLIIRADEAGIPLAKEVYRSALRAGAYPRVLVNIDGLDEVVFKEASDAQLDYIWPSMQVDYDTVDALCAITAPTNTAALSNVDPARQARAQKANRELRKKFFERAAAGTADWVLTLYPTSSAAQNAGLSLPDYEEFLFDAMFLNDPDPAAAWRAFSEKQQKYVDYLNKVKNLRFVATDTDIALSVAGRTWINSDGHKNFPSGEVFTGPVEDSVNGTVSFTFPGAHMGHEVDGIRLTFQDGEVVKAEATHGKEFLDAMLASDPGAKRLGEVAIGNNYGVQRFTRNTLYDEKIGGTFHMAIGNAYPETGGTNVSAVHWDMVCDMRPAAGGGAIYADGILIHENGEWKI